jgi:Right handed beta helix region
MFRFRALAASAAVALTLGALAPSELHAGTLHVPSEYPTIQAAIDASADGDIVELADGTYTGYGNKNIDFRGKAITVRSASGDPNLCIIDCEREGRGFSFYNDEGADSVLSGLAIRNGDRSDSGGGIYIRSSTPTLLNCEVSGCWSGSRGGGVYCQTGADATFVNCTVANNTSNGDAWDKGGGGVYCRDSDAILVACEIVNNRTFGSYGDGGGVVCVRSSAFFYGCTIAGNESNDAGGILCVYEGHPTFIGCIISSNVGEHTAGGIACRFGSAPVFVSSLIMNNRARQVGGLIFAWEGCDVRFNDCSMTGNDTDLLGAGIACDSIDEPSDISLAGCVFRNGDGQIWNNDDSNLAITYSSVEGSYDGIGNIDADPLFIDPDGPDDDPSTWQDNDYRLSPGSPCIDAGDNTAVPADEFDLDNDGDTTEPIPFDLAGNPRFIDDPNTIDTGNPGAPGPLIDMGAYEFQLGPPCPGDIDGDGDTDQSDLGLLLVSYEKPLGDPLFNPDADLNGDGQVGQPDLGILLADYGCAL